MHYRSALPNTLCHTSLFHTCHYACTHTHRTLTTHVLHTVYMPGNPYHLDIPFHFHFVFSVTDVLLLSVPCMLAVFPHRPHHHLLLQWVHLHRVVLQVSASGVHVCLGGGWGWGSVHIVVLMPLTGDAPGLCTTVLLQLTTI